MKPVADWGRCWLLACLVALGSGTLWGQDTIFLKGDTIRVGELEWGMEKDYKMRGRRFSQNKDLYGEQVYIYFQYHSNKMVEEITFGYVEGKRFIEHGPSRFYYDSGHLMGKRYFVEGKHEGKAADYYKDGTLQCEGEFHDDLLHGPSRYYYPDGKLWQKGNFYRDEPVGTYYSYFSNGRLDWVSHTDSSGLRQGTDSVYYESGNLQYTFPYRDDLEHGESGFWHRNGKVWSRRRYENGRLKEVLFNHDREGNPQEIGTFDGSKGYVNVYNDEGILVERQHYKDGYLRKVEDLDKGK